MEAGGRERGGMMMSPMENAGARYFLYMRKGEQEQLHGHLFFIFCLSLPFCYNWVVPLVRRTEPTNNSLVWWRSMEFLAFTTHIYGAYIHA
jgi:hypothetical protein